jgi:hypothetical protein
VSQVASVRLGYRRESRSDCRSSMITEGLRMVRPRVSALDEDLIGIISIHRLQLRRRPAAWLASVRQHVTE